MREGPSQSAEDYLERIHELFEEKGYARVVDIASSLKVKQASVTSMVQKLGEAGYLKYEKYRGLILTEKGRAVARRRVNECMVWLGCHTRAKDLFRRATNAAQPGRS